MVSEREISLLLVLLQIAWNCLDFAGKNIIITQDFLQVVRGKGNRVEVHKQPEVLGGERACQGHCAWLQDQVH